MRRIGNLAALLAGLAAPALWAQSTGIADLQKEVSQLKTQLQAMRSDLDQIRSLLREQNSRATPTFDITGYPTLGNPEAKLVLIELSDFECPYCSEYVKTSYRQIIDAYVETGKLFYVFADFPGEKIHPNAVKAAIAGRCAAEQGKFWDLHDQLFAHQRDLGTTGIADAAKMAGLRQPELDACLSADRYSAKIRESEAATVKLGLQGTPAFVFGSFEPASDSKVKLVHALVGNQPYSAFQKTIDGLLVP